MRLFSPPCNKPGSSSYSGLHLPPPHSLYSITSSSPSVPTGACPVRRRAGGIDSFPSTGCSPKLRPRPRNKEKHTAVDGQTGNLFPGCREGPHVVPCGALDPGYRHIPEDPVFGEGAGEEVFITFMVQRIGTETEAKKEVALSSSKTMFRA